jgi:hypothetical protein
MAMLLPALVLALHIRSGVDSLVYARCYLFSVSRVADADTIIVVQV